MPWRGGSARGHERGNDSGWLEAWTDDPGDIIRHTWDRKQVKEIYDACHVLAQDPDNVILNQFSEFGNYIIHRAVTGPALARVFEAVRGAGSLRARAFVAASGSAGTLAGWRSSEGRAGHGYLRRRGFGMPDLALTTAMASTTSKASATSTCRSSTTC